MSSPPRSEGLVLGRLLGVPVILARSWFVIAAVITLLFGSTVARAAPEIGALGHYAVAFGYAVLLGVSVLVHELAHAVVARRCGLPATRIVLTLWGGHTQFENDLPSPGRAFAVAVAGPLANGALALLALVPVQLLDTPPLVSLLLTALLLTNAFVAVFNLLPGLPLDGGHLLEAVVWRATGDRDRGTVAAGWTGRVVAVLVPVGALGWPLLHGAPPSLFQVVWAGAIGAVLWSGAGQGLRGARIRRRAPAARARELARPAVGVPAHEPLSAALAASAAVPGGAWVVLLDHDGAPSSLLDPDAVAAVPPERRPWVPASSAARSLVPGTRLPEHLEGAPLLRAMSTAPAEEWVLLDERGAVSGLLLARDVVAVVMGPGHTRPTTPRGARP